MIVPEAIPFDIQTGPATGPSKIVVFGGGGIGKSTLCAHLPGPLFLDLEEGTRMLDTARVPGITSFLQLRGIIATLVQSPPPGVQSVIVDTATVAERLSLEHVVEHRTTERGKRVGSIEEFGWGKGWQFMADEFNLLLADLDRLCRAGMNVALVAHEVSSPVPNPAGEDFIRWEPALYAGDKKGRGSIRDRVFQWADHVLFVGYDLYVREGKAQGSGTRTIYTSELPTHRAKSRSNTTSVPYTLEDPGAVWRALGVVA